MCTKPGKRLHGFAGWFGFILVAKPKYFGSLCTITIFYMIIIFYLLTQVCLKSHLDKTQSNFTFY